MLLFMAVNLGSIMGLILLIMTDKIRDRRALTAHFLFSMTLSFVLCFGKALERGGFKNFMPRDILLCMIVVIRTFTCNILSAIWTRGGTEALKREAKALPGNLWHFLYESRD